MANLTVSEVVEQINETDGLVARQTSSDSVNHDIIAGVTEESAIGQFFATVRELGVSRYDTRRDGMDEIKEGDTLNYHDVVMDSWINL